ncbi:hypothetical protein TCAL_13164 [Tigriopus californicus]|uniref:Integrase catalytic domain-containing protein n=1 Tax=Tigriopus californicus TaxID=6832 RepID=A0A553PS41_TIGCA|nr:hypothetical protein TCAL_13164 [Tigriopus californicus]|eukprot:TCALIF_13164-PA protein Name:"Similar to K02A2.6 Uncharacterized protein K02A2.6 (Caenorhabditis elegans)" AED:0.07 eAED:0.25 QI:0/-1/0/1/-1/1/1/0/221
MQHVSVDLFDLKGTTFLVMVDHYLGFPFVAKLRSTSIKTIVDVLLRWFTDVGLPEVIKSDNGPQFRGLFLEFCEKFGVQHETSSPYHPKVNGLAEAGVEAMKTLLSMLDGKFNSEDFKIVLLSWRPTPRADAFSPPYGHFCQTLGIVILRNSCNLHSIKPVWQRPNDRLLMPAMLPCPLWPSATVLLFRIRSLNDGCRALPSSSPWIMGGHTSSSHNNGSL